MVESQLPFDTSNDFKPSSLPARVPSLQVVHADFDNDFAFSAHASRTG